MCANIFILKIIGGRMKHRKYKDYHKIIDGVEYKQCKDCLEWFIMNNDNFGIDNKNKDKYNVRCKKCNYEYNDILYLKDKERRIAKAVDWWENNKERHRENHRRYERTPKFKKWMRKNQIEMKDYRSQYRKDHPEQMRKYSQQHRNHDITESEWRKELKVFNYECAYCGLPQEDHWVERDGKYINMKLHKDHVDDKGANDLRNATPACQSCNSSKHESDMEKWYRKQVFFNQGKYNKIVWWVTEGYKKYIDDKPPYRIIRKQNEGKKNFHWELWTVDELRNMVELIDIGNRKKDLNLELLPMKI